MEWEELQATWAQLGQELEEQKKLTKEIIMKMTQEKFTNKFRTLTQIETVGAIICYAAAIGVLVNFNELNTWYLALCGILTLAFITILPTMVLRALAKIRNLNIIQGTFKDNLRTYTKAKNHLLRLQRTGIMASFVSLFICLPVAAKLLSNKNIFEIGLKPTAWIGLGVVVILMFFFSRWGYRGYKKVTSAAENLLRDLE